MSEIGAGEGDGLRADGKPWEPLDTVVVIETPEHVRFRYLLAGPSRRLAAYAIDTAVRALVLGALGLTLWAGGIAGKDSVSGVAAGLLWLVAFLLEWAYFVVFETLWNGQSPGKRMLKLRVVNAEGRPLGFVDSVLRNVLRAADFLPMFYVVGFVVVASDSRFRRLGDFVGGTLVVAEDARIVDAQLGKLEMPSPTELARVPAHVTLLPREMEAIELYLRRRPLLSEARAEELAKLAATAIARRTRLEYAAPDRFLEILYFRALGGSRGLA